MQTRKTGNQWIAELYRQGDETPIVSFRGFSIYKQNDGFIAIPDLTETTEGFDLVAYEDNLDVLVERILQRLGI